MLILWSMPIVRVTSSPLACCRISMKKWHKNSNAQGKDWSLQKSKVMPSRPRLKGNSQGLCKVCCLIHHWHLLVEMVLACCKGIIPINWLLNNSVSSLEMLIMTSIFCHFRSLWPSSARLANALMNSLCTRAILEIFLILLEKNRCQLKAAEIPINKSEVIKTLS